MVDPPVMPALAPPAPLALFGDLGFQELLLVAVVSVMIFGKRLPEVAGQAFAQFQKMRRTLSQMWRETGIDEELRRIQRDVERELPRERRLPAAPRRPPAATVACKKETAPAPDPPESPAGRGWQPAPRTDPSSEPGPAPAEQAVPAPDAEPEAAERATSSSPGEARREP